ncbi:MAG TPA: DUF2203 family protein [Gammaproteobacteria bacterium]|nr:DUF2203 family protein [Gammaproteobacteria bacterium]
MININRRHVNYESAEQMIPEVKAKLIRIQQLNILIQNCLKTLRTKNIKFHNNMDDMDEYDNESIDTISSLKIMLSTVQNEIDILKDQGCLLINIEKGIIHWHSQHNNKEIILSWVSGEQPRCHWHYQEDDFDNRKPMKELSPVS